MRKTANDDVAKRKDDIFDQYLEDPDWGECKFLRRDWGLIVDVTPRAALPENIEKFLDLSASEEDHGEVSKPVDKCRSGLMVDLNSQGLYDASRSREKCITLDTSI